MSTAVNFADFSTVMCARQKKDIQAHVHGEIDSNSIRFHAAAVKVALNPQYSW